MPNGAVVQIDLVGGSKFVKYGLRSPQLPLAVYREVAAHLCQVADVSTELEVQQSSQFEYSLSQVEQLWIEHPDHLSEADRTQLQRILAYYGDRYGAWEPVEIPTFGQQHAAEDTSTRVGE